MRADQGGGGPVEPRIFLSSPDVTQAEEDALVRAFRSNWIAPLGPEVDAFEAELAEYSGVAHAVALSSGTAALHLGLLTLGVGPSDLVLTATLTFAATANAITYTGAEPVFVDCDETGNINPDLLEHAFETVRAEGATVKAVVPVDMVGKVADHARIAEIAARYGADVLSDAAESMGATRDGRSAASFGAAAALSFNGNKIMTTSGGGALLTDDEDIAQHVRHLATQARQPVVHYEHTDVGYNYRLSNLLAALGRSQLARLDEMIERRHAIRAHYRELFDGVPGVTLFGEPSEAEGTRDNCWLTSILIDPAAAGFSRDDLWAALNAENIESRPLWKPMHAQPVFAGRRAFVDGTADRLFLTGLTLPSGSVLNDDDLARVSRVVTAFLAGDRAS
ncbi:MAG: aminotransferase class I/II-fold pyridoxal phosphate-dependent enzyme [Lentisphaerae bacterium]|nr:aminotransferase class I/II-fold pyridoxal phosphate-dependent enzyme [Lentisphaerota bacterium]